MTINNVDIILKIITSKGLVHKKKGSKTKFSLSGLYFICPNVLARHILEFLRKGNINNLRSLLALHIEKIETNF